MGRRIMVLVLALVVGLFAYLGYNSYDAKRAGLSGDVFSNDTSGGKSKDWLGLAAGSVRWGTGGRFFSSSSGDASCRADVSANGGGCAG